MKPVYIEGCYGVLHEADGRRGVVICGALGDEGLNTYRSQVLLAERLASAGFPTLRISYHGTGESAGDDGEPDRLRAWINSIIAAVRWLRGTCDVTSVALCGVRIGAALAAHAASELSDVDELVLLAPVVSGRRYLRELTFAAQTIAEIWQTTNRVDDGGWFEAHGVRIDRETRDALEKLDLRKLRCPSVRRALLLDLPDAVGGNRLADNLESQGVAVTLEPLDNGDRMLRDSHEAEPPHQAFVSIATWLGDAKIVGPRGRVIETRPLELDGLQEMPVRFGPDNALAGILAVPTQRNGDAPVILIASTGANPSYGNSRGATALARWLATQGVTSLRMDGRGIGDAAPATGERGSPYTSQGNEDVSAGVDFLVSRFTGPIVVLGMCSGAYHAFQAALDDRRISGLILVNLQKFVWRGGESLSVVQRTTFRTTGFYLRNTVKPDVWRRLVRGQINIAGITRALAGRAARQLAAAADPAIAAVRGETQVGMVRRQLDELSDRSTHILYVLSGNDPGLDEIAEYFGVRGWRLRHNPSITFHTIRGADHTLSTHWARECLKRMIATYLHQRFGLAGTGGSAEATSFRRGIRRFTTGVGRPRANVIDSAPTAA